MDFVGNLNFANPVAQAQGNDEYREAFAQTRLGRPTLIHDARLSTGVMEKPVDSTSLLVEGAGFLLVRAPSAVTDWTDVEEVASVYYDEACTLLQERQSVEVRFFPSLSLDRIRNTLDSITKS